MITYILYTNFGFLIHRYNEAINVLSYIYDLNPSSRAALSLLAYCYYYTQVRFFFFKEIKISSCCFQFFFAIGICSLSILFFSGFCKCSQLLWAAYTFVSWQRGLQNLLCTSTIPSMFIRRSYESDGSDWKSWIARKGSCNIPKKGEKLGENSNEVTCNNIALI